MNSDWRGQRSDGCSLGVIFIMPSETSMGKPLRLGSSPLQKLRCLNATGPCLTHSRVQAVGLLGGIRMCVLSHMLLPTAFTIPKLKSKHHIRILKETGPGLGEELALGSLARLF